jgi:hypothetical protein
MFVYDLKSAWCERERAKLRQFLDLLESGKWARMKGRPTPPMRRKRE